MRKVTNYLLPILAGLCALVSGAVLLGIIGAILFRGLPALSWHFLTEQIRLVGAEGGIFFNLVGTLILIGTALCVAAPTALALALTYSVHLSAGPVHGAAWRCSCMCSTAYRRSSSACSG